MGKEDSVIPSFGDVILFDIVLPTEIKQPYGIIIGNCHSEKVSLSFDSLCYLDNELCLSFGKTVIPVFNVSGLEYVNKAQTIFFNHGPDKKQPRIEFKHTVNLWKCKTTLSF